MTETTDPFDALITDAMRARPRPVPASDLAGRALTLAARSDADLDRRIHGFARIRRRSGWATLAAAILVALLVGWVVHGSGWEDWGNPRDLTSPAVEASESDTNALGNITPDDVAALAGVFMLVGLAMIALDHAFSSPQSIQDSIVTCG